MIVADETVVAELEGEIAQVCGVMNAAAGRLIDLIARVLATGAWEGAGIRSAEQWVAWKCGVSPARARTIVAMARRLGEFPETKAAMEAGELCEDQVAVICRHAPAGIDAQAAELARSATVVQLRRVLGSYVFEAGEQADTSAADEPEPPRRTNFGHDDEGSWTLSAQLSADEGALVERALAAARDELFRAKESDRPTPADVSWADALVAMAERSLAPGAECRPHHDRHLVVLHVDTDPTDATSGHLPFTSAPASAKACGGSSGAMPGSGRSSRRVVGR